MDLSLKDSQGCGVCSMTEEKKGHHHRSSLKQRNKPFKGGNRSHSRGRVENKKKGARTTIVDLCKADRKNRATLLQQNKRENLTLQRRIYSGKDGMSIVVMIVPVTASVDMSRVIPWGNNHQSHDSEQSYYSERNKQNLQFIPICREEKDHADWTMAILESAQIADCILFVASSKDEEFDKFGHDALAIIRGIGASSSVAVLQGLASFKKHIQNIRASWLNAFQSVMSPIAKTFCADSMFTQEDSHEAIELDRVLCKQHLHGISWRDVRPYMLTQQVETDGESNAILTGFIRGGIPFSANRPIHVPLLGDTFVCSKIEAIPRKKEKGIVQQSEMDIDQGMIIQFCDKETSVTEHQGQKNDTEPFTMSVGESDTNDVEMKDTRHTLNDIPKGTSSYQAAWMVDSKEEEMDDERTTNLDTMDEIDIEEHDAKLQEHKLQFNERHFPDEIELDPFTSAKERLQKYRGVQSLRTCPWDPNENLPHEYSHIFRFANYKQSRKVALEEDPDSPFHVGQVVSLFLKDLSMEQIQILKESTSKPIAVFGLLKHEQRKTVLNLSLNRSKSYNDTLESKQELIAMIGFRKFIVNPIFSDHSLTNLHKMIRNVDSTMNTMFIGTIYAPVSYNPTPVLLFKRSPDSGDLELVASGSVQDVDPNRIILKRITLTGSPFRVHKRSAVIRFMFSNPDDIMWFKPVELTSRLGVRGHIRESLGTHGYMKCIFDRTVFHHDTVAMHLYKRVFPKWTTIPYRH